MDEMPKTTWTNPAWRRPPRLRIEDLIGKEPTMTKKSTDAMLKSYSADELMAELRLRETPGAMASAVRKSSKERALAGVDSAEVAKALREAQKVIYGTDDRQEAFAISDPGAKANAEAVASLIDISKIDDNGNGTSTIRTILFGVAQDLCNGERFRDQPTSPFCTGFLVGRDIIATAGHCIDGNSIGPTRFVFGFRMNPDGTPNVVVSNDDIYRGVSIIARKLEGTGSDYAVVRVDRPVAGRPILPLRRTGKIADGRSVYVLGHPSGLPLKYAPNANVRTNSAASFFVANLDTYGGNSGSPVFDDESDTVEGILVRGETDFVSVGGCRVSNVCPTSGCRGEDVTRATEFASFVPETDMDDTELDVELKDRVDQLEDQVGNILAAVKRIEDKLA
jgi:hypothetical protein